MNKKKSLSDIIQSRQFFPYVLLIPALFVLVSLIMFPFGYNLWQSLYEYNLVYPKDLSFQGAGNYLKILLKDDIFWHSLKVTGYFTGGSLLLELLLGLGVALLLNEEFRGRNLIRVLLMLPMVATPVAVSYMWRIMYNPILGIINYFLRVFHLPQWAGIFDASTTMPSLIIVDVWQWTPFMALIILAGLMSLPREPLEAAEVDGASFLQSFWYVTLPVLKPVIFIAVLLRAIDLFKTFDIIYALTGGGPGRISETLNIYIYLTAFRTLEMGYASALTLIALAVIIGLCTVLIRVARIET
jgi:multiple sugar transport system permease protein